MPDDITIGRVPFDEALASIRSWLPMTDAQFQALSEKAKRDGFSFAESAQSTMSADVQAILQDAMTLPVGRVGFRDLINEVLGQYDTGVSATRADLIFETNIGRAFNDGKWRQYHRPELKRQTPYLGVDTAYDAVVRPNHFALDYRRIKTVFAIDDVLWTMMRPPFGFRCRCTLMSFTEEDVQRLGLTVGRGEDFYGKTETVEVPGGKAKTVQILPDTGWSLMGHEMKAVALILALSSLETCEHGH
jgi:SPP1 gp7 family putative phage head morphogenesis protein